MKKIIIISQAMEVGGAEKALLGLLEQFDTSKYLVDLFLLRHSGELMKYIPSGIRLLPENPSYATLAKPITKCFGSHQYMIGVGRLYGKAKTQMYKLKHGVLNVEAIEDLYSHKYTFQFMPMINEEEYDLAISFLAPHYIVINKVKAKKKIGWIHTDYETLELDAKSEMKMWEKLDHIISISNSVTDSFLKEFPQLKNKIVLVQNIFPMNYLNSLISSDNAEKEMPNNGSIRLLSVGRFCKAKNFDSIPEICRHIIDFGLEVMWYIIGYGQEEELIREKIKEYGMEKRVVILGKRINPYPYYKQCDIYVQPSRFEGKCVSVIEAQMMQKPVIITNFSTSCSQLRDGIDGIIVPMDPNECAKGIAALIKNPNKMRELTCACSAMTYVNKNEIDKIYALI